MNERDCTNCKHHTSDGCSSWDCEFEAKDLISRADVLKFPIRLDHYDEEHGNRDFVLGIESVMEYVESLPSADAVPQLKQTDTLIIADALRYLAQDTERHLVDRTRADALRQQFLKYGASMCKGGAE